MGDNVSATGAKLIYTSNMSIDGWTEDTERGFSWAPPDDDVFVFITELMGSVATYLYGRRMYETLAVWETDASLGAIAAHRGLRPHVAGGREDRLLLDTRGADHDEDPHRAVVRRRGRPGAEARRRS
jgi:hypothetical protein